MELVFVAGGKLRRIFINNREISFLTSETGFHPIVINLDKLNKLDENIKSKMGEEQIKLIEEIPNLHSEEEIAKDIIKDFQSTGWRLIKKI